MLQLDHIALIVSSEASVVFYRELGFTETNRIKRSYDTVVFMERDSIVLEIFIDPNHPGRAANPEAHGLRHICLTVENFDEFVARYDHDPVRTDWFGRRFLFLHDPDGQPIELAERNLNSVLMDWDTEWVKEQIAKTGVEPNIFDGM